MTVFLEVVEKIYVTPCLPEFYRRYNMPQPIARNHYFIVLVYEFSFLNESFLFNLISILVDSPPVLVIFWLKLGMKF